MEIRNRIDDVNKLRCNVLQSFIKLIICDDWQQKLYDEISEKIKTGFRSKYIMAYGEMRNASIENYSINDMDVTLMTEILLHTHNIFPKLQNETKNAITQVSIDRNLVSHNNYNEDAVELYLRAIISLYDLQYFIETVDRNEKENIADPELLNYRSHFMNQIKNLQLLLDNERIELILNLNNYDKDINNILKAENPLHKWTEIYGLYLARDKANHTLDEAGKFSLRASDKGVEFAHIAAANFSYYNKDYEDWKNRLALISNSTHALNTIGQTEIIDINEYIKKNKNESKEIQALVSKLIDTGKPISILEDGSIRLEKKVINANGMK